MKNNLTRFLLIILFMTLSNCYAVSYFKEIESFGDPTEYFEGFYADGLLIFHGWVEAVNGVAIANGTYDNATIIHVQIGTWGGPAGTGSDEDYNHAGGEYDYGYVYVTLRVDAYSGGSNYAIAGLSVTN